MKRLLVILLLLLHVAVGHTATTLELATGTSVNALTTELNSLANNAWTAASATIDNRIGQTMNGYMVCRVEFAGTFAANPTAGGAITGFFLKTVDGTTFETTPTATVGLNRLPNFVIPVMTGQTASKVSIDVLCPAERFKVCLQNTATGQAMAASGNTVKIMPVTPQGN